MRRRGPPTVQEGRAGRGPETKEKEKEKEERPREERRAPREGALARAGPRPRRLGGAGPGGPPQPGRRWSGRAARRRGGCRRPVLRTRPSTRPRDRTRRARRRGPARTRHPGPGTDRPSPWCRRVAPRVSPSVACPQSGGVPRTGPRRHAGHAGIDGPAPRSGCWTLDALVPTGGGDVAPALYGAEAHERTHRPAARSGRVETALLEAAIAAVCRSLPPAAGRSCST